MRDTVHPELRGDVVGRSSQGWSNTWSWVKSWTVWDREQSVSEAVKLDAHNTSAGQAREQGFREKYQLFFKTQNNPDTNNVTERKEQQKLFLRNPQTMVVASQFDDDDNEEDESEQHVSWLRLLQKLHQLYSSYWRYDCSRCNPHDRGAFGWEAEDSSFQKSTESDEQPTKGKSVKEIVNLARTSATVIYREWHWDFMPPDISRPLAQSSVGAMVVLALRMGMEWRDIDVANGRLQASGNGFSLSSSDVRGLGIVLRFNTGGHHNSFPRIAPSRAADKLLCGIIPGDPDFGCEDFPFVGDDRKVHRIEQNGGILSRIGVHQEWRDFIGKHSGFQAPHNELIALLCPFLALEGSTIGRHLFPGWREKLSSFHIWESRLSLLRNVEQRLNATTSATDELIGTVYASLKELERDYHDDWYSRLRQALIMNYRGRDDGVRKRDLLEACRRIFQKATELLKKHHMDEPDEKSPDQPRFAHLVAAHACMSAHAVKSTNEKINEEKTKSAPEERTPKKLKMRYHVDDSHGVFFTPWFYELVNEYVKHVRDPHHGIGAYLREHGMSFDDDRAEALWWSVCNFLERGLEKDMC
ncbi:MAG: hypothetical protein Q9162_001732 [Coniocarpon cinnabarinum]